MIDQEDIQKTGEMTISDVLREIPINTYGSFMKDPVVLLVHNLP